MGLEQARFLQRLGFSVHPRCVDVVVNEIGADGVVRVVHREIKNLQTGARFRFRGEVGFDIRRAIDRSTVSGGLDLDLLGEELRGIEYTLRGTPAQMANAINGLKAEIRRLLLSAGSGAGSYANMVSISAISRPIPF
jgi:hypothetical protein